MASSIPVIDLSQPIDDVAPIIDAACKDTGFFTVINHGVPRAVVGDTFDAAKRFFEMPLADKLEVKRPRPEQNRGFIAQGTETLSRLAGKESPPDYKEVFTVGPEVPDEPYYQDPAAYPNFAPNLWPRQMPEFKPTLMRYMGAVEAMAHRILQACSIALDLDRDFFVPKVDRGISMFRIISYPPYATKPLAGQLRAGVHTDLSLLTILTSNEAIGGLEVRNRAGNWVAPPTRSDSFVVNIGDMMMRWTNDRWVSTPHRVVNPPDATAGPTHRFSLAYFMLPNYDAVIEAVPGSDQPKYEPISAAAYRTSRFAATANSTPRM